MYLNNVNQIRQVEWAKSYNWDIIFYDSAASPTERIAEPFDNWFPAIDLEENTANLETHTIEAFQDSYKIPLKSSPKELRVTFQDDHNHVLNKWLNDWVNIKILNKGKFISTLADSVKLVQVVRTSVSKLQDAAGIAGQAKANLSGFGLPAVSEKIPDIGRNKTTVYIASYWVFPEGNVTFAGNSESGNVSYSQTFVIAGVVDRKYFRVTNRGEELGERKDKNDGEGIDAYLEASKVARMALTGGPMQALSYGSDKFRGMGYNF